MDYTTIDAALQAFEDKGKLTGFITTVIIMLLGSIFLPPLKRHDRFGNIHARLGLVWILVVSLVVLTYNISYWWLLLCLVPFVYLAIRWLYFTYEVKRLKDVRKKDFDKAKVNLFRKLSNECMFEWELRCFVIPLLDSLYTVGAFNSLESELEKYSAYSNNKRYRLLKAIMLAQKCKSEAIDILKPLSNNPKKQDIFYAVAINNLYVAAKNRNDYASMDVIFSKMENYVSSVENKDSIIIEILIAMFYRYDQMGNINGISSVRSILNHRTPKTFNEYLDIKDIEMYYDRRHGNRQGIINYLDEAFLKVDEMEPDEEARIIFKLRILPRFIEFDHRWREMTIDVFEKAEYYLGYPESVAMAYIEMLTSVMSDALSLHGQSLQEDQLLNLMKKAYSLAAAYLYSIKTKIFEIEDIYLYRKIAMYRHLFLFARIGTYIGVNMDTYVGQLIDSHKKILELCMKNGQEMEYLHFLMTYIDEYITIKEQIIRMSINSDIDSSIKRINAEEPNIKAKLIELKDKLRESDYNASVAYPTLWAANFCFYYGETNEARQLLQKFQEHKIDIRNFTEPVQRMYAWLCQRLSA